MRFTATTTALLVALLASQALSQESTREDFQEFCKTWQGRWVGEVTWVADWPAFGKKGDKVMAYVELRLVEDGNALTGRFFGGHGSSTFFAFFDAGSKRIKFLTVNSNGGMTQDLIYKKGSKWTFQHTGSLSDGTKTEGVSTITISDNGNIHTWTGSGKVGDKKNDDQHDVWRRLSN